MANRMGTQESVQISKMGVLDIGSGDFVSEFPVCIKNDGDEAVVLEVNLWDMPSGEYVQTAFEVGWNPEIVRAVRRKAGLFDLKWGM